MSTKKDVADLQKEKSFVTKNTWELVFGWIHYSNSWSTQNRRYIEKYGHYRGTNPKRERR